MRFVSEIKYLLEKITITCDTPKPCYTDEGSLIINVYDFLLKLRT